MKVSGFSFLAVSAAVAAAASQAAAPKTVRDGIQAWQRSDYASAVTIWRPLAEKGNAEAQYYTDRSENARIEDGKLVIEARKDNWQGNKITSASIGRRMM